MKTPPLPRPLLALSALLALAPLVGCDDGDESAADAAAPDLAALDGGTPDSGAPDDEEVVAVSIRVRNPEGRNIYLGAYRGVPEGELDRSRMIELADNDVDYHDGYAYDFSRETGSITRYSVDAELNLVQGPTLSLANLGLNGARGTAFVSDTRAYSYGTTGAALLVAVFDPTAMELDGSIPADALANDDYPIGIVGKPAIFGDYVVFALDWSDRANLRINPKVQVAFVHKDRDDEPLFLVEDDRCAGAYNLFVDDAGDLYVTGTSGGGYFRLYGDEAADLPPSCALRIKAGETAFDDAFHVDLEAATGSRTVYGAWHVADRRMLVLGLQPGEVPEASAYLTEALFDPYLVDLDTGESEPMGGIPPAMGMSWREHRVDGTLFYQVYTSVMGAASVDVYRVDAAGEATRAFGTLGDPWSLGTMRIR